MTESKSDLGLEVLQLDRRKDHMEDCFQKDKCILGGEVAGE